MKCSRRGAIGDIACVEVGPGGWFIPGRPKRRPRHRRQARRGSRSPGNRRGNLQRRPAVDPATRRWGPRSLRRKRRRCNWLRPSRWKQGVNGGFHCNSGRFNGLPPGLLRSWNLFRLHDSHNYASGRAVFRLTGEAVASGSDFEIHAIRWGDGDDDRQELESSPRRHAQSQRDDPRRADRAVERGGQVERGGFAPRTAEGPRPQADDEEEEKEEGRGRRRDRCGERRRSGRCGQGCSASQGCGWREGCRWREGAGGAKGAGK